MDANHTTFYRLAWRRRGCLLAVRVRLFCVLMSLTLLAWSSLAQAPVVGRGKNFVAPVTDAQGHKSILRGESVKPVGKGLVEMTKMQAETFRGQVKDMIVTAPQCVFDTKANVATSPGTLSIRKADDSFSIQGEGFQWQLGDSGANSRLMISNRVHSLVRKSGVKAASLLGRSTATNVTAQAIQGVTTDQFVDITADRFEYQSDRAVFRGQVQVHESEGDLVCAVLTVIFAGENAMLRRIEAEREVILTQGTSRVMADRAIYTLGEEKELVEFTGRAVWQEGDRRASGERVTFNRLDRTIRAEANAYLKVPRSVLGESGFLSGRPTPAAQLSREGSTSFVEVFADSIMIRLPPATGPVQEIVAEKKVLIVDLEQQGRALADRAVYTETNGVLELTGSPIVETEHRIVMGKTLRFERTTRMFTAAPDAYVKLPYQALTSLGILSMNAPAQKTATGGTNRFLEVWSTQFTFETNRLNFREHVRANFLDREVTRGKLSCATMTIAYGERIESLVADGGVEAEEFASTQDPRPTSRRMTCAALKLDFGPDGRLAVAVAEKGVTAEQEEVRADRPRPIVTHLTSGTVTAYFSKTTNKVDRVEADEQVVFSQDGRTANGAKAVYTDQTGLVELTGQPTASMPEGTVTEAERLIWDRIHERFMAKGKFKSEWKQPASAKKSGVSQGEAGTP